MPLQLNLALPNPWLDAVLSSVTDSIVVTNCEGLVRDLNDAACALLGRDRGACVEHPAAEVLDLRNRRTGELVDLFKTGADWEGPAALLDLDVAAGGGTRLSVDGMITPICDDGNPLGFVVSFREVAMERIAADMAHELAVAFTSILKTGRRVATGKLTPARAGALIGCGAEHGLQVIEQLLSLTQHLTQAAEHADIRRGSPAGDWPTVLLVDTDDASRRMLHTYLEAHHYNALEAGDCVEALEVASLHKGEIHAMVVKGAGGSEAVRRIRYSRPGMKALAIGGEGGPEGMVTITGKVTKRRLIERLRELLRGQDDRVLAGLVG